MLHQILKFTLLSGVGTLLHFAVLWSAVEWASAPVLLASTLGAICGMLFNYFAHYHLTFRSGAEHRRSLPLFVFGGVSSILLNAALMWAFLAASLYYLLAQVLSTATVFVFNFLYAKHVAFRS